MIPVHHGVIRGPDVTTTSTTSDIAAPTTPADVPAPASSTDANNPQPTDPAPGGTPTTAMSGGGGASDGGGDGGQNVTATPTSDPGNGDNGSPGADLSVEFRPAPAPSDGSALSSSTTQAVVTAVGSKTQNMPSSGDSGNENKLGAQNGVPGVASQRQPISSQSLTMTTTQQPSASNLSMSENVGDSSGRLSNSAIALIIAASIALVLIFMTIVIVFIRKHREKEEHEAGPLAPKNAPVSQVPAVDLQDESYHHRAGRIENFLVPGVAPSLASDDSPLYSIMFSSVNGGTVYGDDEAAGLVQPAPAGVKKGRVRRMLIVPPYQNFIRTLDVGYQGDLKHGKAKR